MKRRTAGQFRRPLARLAASSMKAEKLHLVHVTSVGAGREIIEQDCLEARYCRHFGRNLVYFFVDRPGYRASESDQKSDQINRFPFVFVCKFPQGLTPYHAYPFDTGAALAGLFDEKADPFVYLEDYELGNEMKNISSHLSWAFDGRDPYFRGILKETVRPTLPPWESVEKSFLDIAQIASPSHNRPDKRASAIEVAYDVNLSLSSRQARVILPKQLLEWGLHSNTSLIRTLDEREIGWAVYNWLPNARPADFFDEIVEIVHDMVFEDGRDASGT